MSLHEFRKKVRNASIARDGEPLYNGSLDHAAILTEQLFDSGAGEMCLLSGELNAKVYGKNDVIEAASIFLADPDNSLKLLVEKTSKLDREGHPFYDRFFNQNRSNIEFKSVDENTAKTYNFHFAVVGADSYRFERDKSLPSAIAAFGDCEGGKNLQEIFDGLWEMSDDINSN